MHGKKFNWNMQEPSIIQGRNMVGKNRLAENIGKAIATSQDVKIQDGPIVIDKDLLQEIRDTLDNESSNGNEYCAHLRDKLDNLYPFLNQQQ